MGTKTLFISAPRLVPTSSPKVGSSAKTGQLRKRHRSQVMTAFLYEPGPGPAKVSTQEVSPACLRLSYRAEGKPVSCFVMLQDPKSVRPRMTMTHAIGKPA